MNTMNKTTSANILSADTHVFEPARLWLDRVSTSYRDRAPFVRRVNDIDTWFCDGHRIMTASAAVQTGKRFEKRHNIRIAGHLEQVRPGSYIPEEMLKDMALDGVDGAVIYPSVALCTYTLPDGGLLDEIFRAYNDWMAEFCRPFPKQLLGIALINLDMDDVKSGVKELERCAKMGLRGALISCYPGEARAYSRPEYEAFWAAAEDLGMALGLHISTNRVVHDGKMFVIAEFDPTTQANADHWVRQSLGHIINSGVFERHPKLYIGAIEYEMAWVPHFLGRLDQVYTDTPFNKYRFKNDLLPSDFFRSNSFVGFSEDPVGVEFRERIGIDNILWGNDYPHPESTFPKSQELLGSMLRDCTDEERIKMTYTNCARIFGLS